MPVAASRAPNTSQLADSVAVSPAGSCRTSALKPRSATMLSAIACRFSLDALIAGLTSSLYTVSVSTACIDLTAIVFACPCARLMRNGYASRLPANPSPCLISMCRKSAAIEGADCCSSTAGPVNASGRSVEYNRPAANEYRSIKDRRSRSSSYPMTRNCCDRSAAPGSRRYALAAVAGHPGRH